MYISLNYYFLPGEFPIITRVYVYARNYNYVYLVDDLYPLWQNGEKHMDMEAGCMRSVSSGMARIYRGKIGAGENFVSCAQYLSH